jgi:hypothetical protein
MKPENKKGMFANGKSSDPTVISLLENTKAKANSTSKLHRPLLLRGEKADTQIREYLHPNPLQIDD